MPWRIWWLSSISRRDPDPGASAGPPRVDPRPRAGPSAGPSIVSPWVTSAILLMRHAMSNGQRPGSFPATNSQNPEAMERHAPTRCLLHLCPGRYSFAAPLGTARTRHARSDRAGARPLLDWVEAELLGVEDRKSTRLNSSHSSISYAVFCLKKKKKDVLVRRLHKQIKNFNI